MRLPISQSISGPASLRPSSPAPVADMSGIARGAANLAGSAGRIVQEERQKQNTIDIARADAFATRSFLDMQNAFEQDGDYGTFRERAETQTNDIANSAGELIRDPEMRQRWVAQNEINRIKQVDAIGDISTARANEAERVAFTDTLADYSRILQEPTTPVAVRNQTRLALAGTIDMARQNGLLTPAEAQKAEQTYLDQAEQQLALNTADMEIRSNPERVAQSLGITADPNDPLGSTRTAIPLPVVAADGVNVQDVDPAALTRWEQVQGAFGRQLPIISGARDDEHNKAVGGAGDSQHLAGNGSKAIDIDVSDLSQPERVRLIETASAMGFTGIGVYNNSLHFDTGTRRAWGPNYKSGSVPGWANDAINRHTTGAIAEVPVGAAAGVDSRFAALDYQQRAALFDRAKQQIETRNMETRAALATTAENAPVAITRSGGYDGYMPTANDFVMAYGARNGLERFEAFDASVKVAQDTFAMRTMSKDEIAAIVEGAVPADTGDGAALQEQSYAQITAAAQATLEAREKDPASYVQQVYPAVDNAWKNIDNEDPESFSRAISVTSMAQEQLGMEVRPLPKQMADNVATTFNNAALTDQERVGALTGIVMGTGNPKQQAAVFDQLVQAGVPETSRAALAALERGDEGAAQRLMGAVLAKPETLNKALPGSIKPAQVDDEIQAQLFDTGQIGDIYYDMTYGTTANVNAAVADAALMANSVKLRLLDGSSGGNLQRAIDLTVTDMFGEVKVVNGKSWGGAAGVKALLPKDADQNTYQQGFDALMGQVGAALADDLSADAGTIFGPVPGGTPGQAIQDAMIANYVEQALSSGYFTNAGDDAFKFIDPNGRGPVMDAAGEPLLFTRDQVLAATAAATAGQEAGRPTQNLNQPGMGAGWAPQPPAMEMQ